MTYKKTIITLVASAVLASTFAVPAQATGFSVAADKSNNLVAAGDTVTVTLTGVPADQGVYVRLCKGSLADVTQARPTQCFGQGAWVSMSAAQQGFGAGNAANPVALAVQAQFDTVNCLVDACGIHIRRDHNGGSADYSLDRFIPVTFAAPVVQAPAPTPKTGVARNGNKLTFTILNKNGKTVTVLVGAKRYVRKVTSNNFTFELPAKATGSVRTTALIGGKKLISKKF